MNIKKIIKDTLTIKFDKAFGLDISDRSVEVIELEKVFRFSAVTYGRAELPEGVIENGRILNQAVLAENIKKLLKGAKPKRVSTNKVILSLPESQVYVKCFEIEAKLKAGALTKAILDKISVALPLNIDKTYWDFITKPLADKNKKLIIFFAVPKDIANSYVKFCNSIGLEVVSLCIESLSLARTILRSSNRQSLIIDIGSRSTNLSFFDSNDKLNISVTIPVAGDNFTEEIQSKLKLLADEAENLKIKLGFKDNKDNNVRAIILPLLQDILNETKGAIDFYEKTFKQKLDDIYLLGGSALLPGIVEEISKYLGQSVKIAEVGSNINMKIITGENKYFPIFANVLGLGMIGASGEFKDMNLLLKMPSAEVNAVNKLNLFNMGYLSKVNALRTILNNKFFLIVIIILIGLIFAILIQQAQNYGYASVSTPTI